MEALLSLPSTIVWVFLVRDLPYPRPYRVLSYCSFLIGFLAGEQVHQKGALNAGLREQLIGVSMIEN